LDLKEATVEKPSIGLGRWQHHPKDVARRTRGRRRPRFKKRVKKNKHFDSTLGFPGEGPVTECGQAANCIVAGHYHKKKKGAPMRGAQRRIIQNRPRKRTTAEWELCSYLTISNGCGVIAHAHDDSQTLDAPATLNRIKQHEAQFNQYQIDKSRDEDIKDLFGHDYANCDRDYSSSPVEHRIQHVVRYQQQPLSKNPDFNGYNSDQEDSDDEDHIIIPVQRRPPRRRWKPIVSDDPPLVSDSKSATNMVVMEAKEDDPDGGEDEPVIPCEPIVRDNTPSVSDSKSATGVVIMEAKEDDPEGGEDEPVILCKPPTFHRRLEPIIELSQELDPAPVHEVEIVEEVPPVGEGPFYEVKISEEEDALLEEQEGCEEDSVENESSPRPSNKLQSFAEYKKQQFLGTFGFLRWRKKKKKKEIANIPIEPSDAGGQYEKIVTTVYLRGNERPGFWARVANRIFKYEESSVGTGLTHAFQNSPNTKESFRRRYYIFADWFLFSSSQNRVHTDFYREAGYGKTVEAVVFKNLVCDLLHDQDICKRIAINNGNMQPSIRNVVSIAGARLDQVHGYQAVDSTAYVYSLMAVVNAVVLKSAMLDATIVRKDGLVFH
jgi:hypothetical protein